ncbi:MAG TPA: hypothetical protein VKK79_15095 [Candidatus Lokiarchaeia archaeon]|nr:hypothetical protein [Candidatus Lokiarchaeia archaeon]
MSVLSVRLDAEIEETLQYLMKARKIVDKSAYIRQLLAHSIYDDLVDWLCTQVAEKKLSAWKAAEVGHVSLRRMLEELAKRHVVTFDEVALEDDLRFARGS